MNGNIWPFEKVQHRVVVRGAGVRSKERPVPLDFEYRETPLHETILELIRRDRAPIYVVNFTQRAAAEEAQNLMSTDYSTKEEKKAIVAALENGVSQVEEGAGRFPQVSGLRFSWDPKAPPMSRIVSVEVRDGDGWAPLDPAGVYMVASNNFMRGGGDGYVFLPHLRCTSPSFPRASTTLTSFEQENHNFRFLSSCACVGKE